MMAGAKRWDFSHLTLQELEQERTRIWDAIGLAISNGGVTEYTVSGRSGKVNVDLLREMHLSVADEIRSRKGRSRMRLRRVVPMDGAR